ncbi:MAG: hypothetical protein ACXWT0_14100 [Methylobacter sp.]
MGSKAEIDEGGDGNEGSGVCNGADSKGTDSGDTGAGNGIGSGLISENSLSGSVLTTCLGGWPLFCVLEEPGRTVACPPPYTGAGGCEP